MIQIHGKNYVTVAERVHEAHMSMKFVGLNTEVLSDKPVVIKATVYVIDDHGMKVSFTGISAANPDKSIEKMSPYEVAETSAVGRALGFAGYGVVDSIATADEMVKASTVDEAFDKPAEGSPDLIPTELGVCKKCGAPMVISKTTGNPYCSAKCWLKGNNE
jgi:hypothetical protein